MYKVKARGNFLVSLVRPEMATCILLIIVLIIGTNISDHFSDLKYILDSTSIYIEYGLIALIMTYLIIAGQMDLSIASVMALSACIAAVLYHAGMPMVIAILITVIIGAMSGFFNSILVTRLSITPLIATIGTMSLYRGVAQVLLGDGSLSGFPSWFVSVDKVYVFGNFPVLLLVFLIVGILMAFVLKKTLFGRQIYQIGSNERAATFCGVSLVKVKTLLYVLSGVFASVGGLLMMSRLTVSRFDMASGGELDVLTMVFLGGANINGGNGSVTGTMISYLLVVLLKTSMMVANIKAEIQLIAMGALLILAIILTNATGNWQNRLKKEIN